MRHLILVIQIIIYSTVWGQTIPDKINNSKTANYTNINGTRLFLVIPQGYKQLKGASGLIRDDGTVISVMDLDGGNFYTNAATFIPSKFEKAGIKVLFYKQTTFNGYPAKYVELQPQGGNKAIELVFGDTTFSIMINCIFPANDAFAEKELRQAVLGAVYDKGFKVNPFANASFKLDDSNSKFKFAKATANLFIYSLNGEVKDGYDNEPTLMVTSLPSDKRYAYEAYLDFYSGLIKHGLSNIEPIEQSSDKFKGYDAYQQAFYCEMHGERTLIYLLVATNASSMVYFIGSTPATSKDNLLAFKKLADTLVLK